MLLVADRFTAFTMRDNDLQEYGTSFLLLADKQQHSLGFFSNGNRLFTDAPPSRWVVYDHQYLSLDKWRLTVTDTTSSAVRVAYPRPEMTLADYDLATGGSGTAEDFLARARAQSRTNWNRLLVGTNVAAVFRANFGVVMPD